ncbi:hypothetical protein GCM10011348_44850 [Marinobacterium nitratireducens]|uniref:Uncharacterized protein n=1 Tax=Marinobacterium nitratireducens TaxID=518897 RepID=A0A917ZRR1_9GAMM|nr:pilus assembly protein TadG-related protein [Marinobacterium nitratireducens]GGO88726.1 hypothetical protein GCM10011348_44850 [Marinobacterium nitratireducens]
MRHCRQRGAIGLSALLLLLSALLFAAFAIDSARLFFAQRELQTQADLAALAMSRGGCYLDGVTDRDGLEGLALDNLALNGFDASSGEASFSFGEAAIADNHWQLAAGGDYQPAGRVSLSRTLPASLLAGGLWGGEVDLGAAAAVYKRMAVGFGLGSGLLDVDLTNSLLGALLGGSVNVLSYEGLASAGLTLGSLLAAADAEGLLNVDLEVGTLDEVLATEVGLADLLAATIVALDSQSLADADVRAALVQLQGAAATGLSLTLSDMLALASGSSGAMEGEIQRAALATEVDLYGLVTGAILAANQGHFIEIPGLAADLGVAGLGVGLTIVEPPRYTFGLLPAGVGDDWMASVETAQIELDIRATLLEGGLDLGLIYLDVGSLGIHVDIARAESRLLEADGCSLADAEVRLDFETRPSVANLTIGDGGAPADPSDFGDPSQPVNLAAGVRLALVTVPVEVNVAVEAPVSSQQAVGHTVLLPRQPLPYTEEGVSAGPGDTLDDSLSGLELDLSVDVLGSTLLGAVIGDVLDLLTASLLPAVGDLIAQLALDVVEPLLRALGITVGYADVIVVSVEFDGSGLIE